jgi:hypothetical protein
MEPACCAAASLEDAASPKASQAMGVNIVEWSYYKFKESFERQNKKCRYGRTELATEDRKRERV